MRSGWVAVSAIGLPVALCACAPVEAARVGRSEQVIAQAERPIHPAPGPASSPWKTLQSSPPTAAGKTSVTLAAELRAAEQKLAATQAPIGATVNSHALAKDRDAWRTVLAQVPELSGYASAFEPFGAKAADEALSRGKRARENVIAWTMADGPLSWTPAPGRELWVAAGSVGERALIAVLAKDQDGSMRHEVSLVIDDQDAQVALAASAEHPDELLWSTCYACPGEGGSIRLGDDGRARFVYR